MARAHRVFEMALQRTELPPPEATQPLLVALVKAGLSGSALELATELRMRGVRLSADSPATTSLIMAAATSEAAFEALSVLDELRQHAAAGCGRLEAAGGASLLLQDELLRQCVRAHNVPAAWALHQEIERTGLEVTAESSGLLVGALFE